MEYTAINLILEMISSGNYAGAVMSLGIVGFVFLMKRLKKIEKLQEPKPKTDYNKFIVEDSLISDELSAIRLKYSADRVLVVELVNGSYNIGDVATLKTLVRGERVKEGIFSVANSINGIPASFYSKILKSLVKGNVFSLDSIESLKNEDFGLYQNLIQTNVKSLYAFPLISNEGILYGYLSLHFCIGKKNLSNQDIENIKDDAERINGEILMMKKTSN